jgi:hypothetical protein
MMIRQKIYWKWVCISTKINRLVRVLNDTPEIPKFICLCIFVYLLIFLSFTGTTNIISAQTKNHTTASMGKSNLEETRRAFSEPSFLKEGSGLRWQGIYFGVGFRHLRLTLGSGTELISHQADQNGIGFQIGLLQEEFAYEYERQISIIDSGQLLTFENESGTRLESIQNTFSFSWYPRLMRDLHGQLGIGLQGNRSSFVGEDSSSKIHSETAIQLNLGGAYFATKNLMLTIRFSQNWPLDLSRSENSPMLKKSQIRTLFLNYYYPL